MSLESEYFLQIFFSSHKFQVNINNSHKCMLYYCQSFNSACILQVFDGLFTSASLIIQISTRKKLFFRVHSANKNSQTRTFSEKTPRDFAYVRADFFFLREISRRNSTKTRGVSTRTFAEFLREISRRYSAKLGVILKNINILFFCFV